MSFLKTSLEKRIKELRKSIEHQTTELLAYEQVLALESGQPVSGLAAAPPALAHAVKQHTRQSLPAKKVEARAGAPITVEFNGSRSDFVASVLKQRAASGVTPSEISTAFAARKISVSKNLVYNVLSLMFQQKKVRKSNGKYYLVGGKADTPKASTAQPAGAKKARISEQGMKRIIAATKKRWAGAKTAKSKKR